MVNQSCQSNPGSKDCRWIGQVKRPEVKKELKKEPRPAQDGAGHVQTPRVPKRTVVSFDSSALCLSLLTTQWGLFSLCGEPPRCPPAVYASFCTFWAIRRRGGGSPAQWCHLQWPKPEGEIPRTTLQDKNEGWVSLKTSGNALLQRTRPHMYIWNTGLKEKNSKKLILTLQVGSFVCCKAVLHSVLYRRKRNFQSNLHIRCIIKALLEKTSSLSCDTVTVIWGKKWFFL